MRVRKVKMEPAAVILVEAAHVVFPTVITTTLSLFAEETLILDETGHGKLHACLRPVGHLDEGVHQTLIFVGTPSPAFIETT